MGRETREAEAAANWEDEGRELEQKQVAALESMAASLVKCVDVFTKGVRVLEQIKTALKHGG